MNLTSTFLRKLFKQFALVVMMANLFMAMPELASANAGANNDGTLSGGESQVNSLNTAVCGVIGILQGPLARGIGTVAIVFLAFGLFAGKMSWGVALSTGLAIAAIFGAADIVGVIAGEDANTSLNCATVVGNVGN